MARWCGDAEGAGGAEVAEVAEVGAEVGLRWRVALVVEVAEVVLRWLRWC